MSLLAKRALARGDRLRVAGNLSYAVLEYGDAARRSQGAAERGSERGARVFALASVGLARIDLARGEPERASEQLEAARAVAPSEKAEIMYWHACARGRADDFARAKALLTDVLRLAPADARARLQRAGARFKTGDLDGALEDYGQLAREDALDDSGRVAYAAVLAHRQQWAQVEVALAPLAGSGAQHAERLLGAVLEKQLRLPDAAAGYARATRGPRPDPALLARLGIVYHRLQRVDEAVTLLIDAREAGSADDAVLYHLGAAAFAAGRAELAIEAWTELAQRNPQQEALAQLAGHAGQAQARELAAAGRVEDAIFALERSAGASAAGGELAQPLAALHLNAAAAKVAQGRLAMAVGHLRRAAELAPDRPRIWMHLGLVEALTGHETHAVDDIERALRLAPNDPATRRAYVLCAGVAGQPERVNHEIDLCLRGGGAPPAMASTVAALLAREARWSDAADVLLAPGQDASPAAIAECLQRAGRFDELDRLDGPDVKVWKVLADIRRRREAAPRLVLSAGVGDSAAWRPTVRLAALRSAARECWEDAAALLDEGLARSDHVTHTPQLDATVLLLGGRHDQALRVLQAACRKDPADTRAAHGLAVAWFHALSHDARLAPDDTAWQHAIGAWVRVMRSDAFWDSWRMRAQTRYGGDDLSDALAAAREQADERFELLVAHADGARGDGRRRLSWWLARERSAADELAKLGGLRLPGADDDAVVCGPLAVGELGLTAALVERVGPGDTLHRDEIDDGLAQLLATLGIEGDDGPLVGAPRSGDRRRLARAFSAIGTVQALIDLGSAAEALQALDEVGCARCTSAARGVHGHSTGEPRPLVVCDIGCPGFDERNPGYAGFPDKHERLLRDAHELAIEAHLEIGREAISITPLDVATARSHFRRALSRGAACGQLDGSERRVTEIILGRSRALEKRETLDDAIALTREMLDIVGDGATPALHGHIGELLTNRGVRHGNADPPRWSASIDDLEDAVRHNPHAPRSWANLAAAKRAAAASHANVGDFTVAAGLISGAVQTLDHATALIPNHPALEQQREGVQHEALIIAMLRATGE